MSTSPNATQPIDLTTADRSTQIDFDTDVTDHLPLHLLSISPTTPTLVSAMQNMQLHISRPQISAKYVCPDCGKAFSHEYTLDRHRKTVCGKPRLLSISPTTPTLVSAMQDMQLHISRPQISAKYVCPDCGKAVSHKYTLDRHRKTVCGKPRNTKGKWKCDSCERTYESQGSLSRHIKYECRVKPQLRCFICERPFTQKCALSRHLKKKHEKALSAAYLSMCLSKQINNNTASE